MFRFLSLSFVLFSLAACDDVMLTAPKVIYESQTKAESIIIDKSDEKIYLLKKGKVIREYDAKMGSTPGKKMFEGDNRTPEGGYFISNKNPNSQYFLSLAISYPNKEDRERAEKMGKNPGGEIMIHGMPNKSAWIERFKNQYEDWTAGCVAVKDKDMVEIYAMVDVGTPILIRK
jgi:murein L,D-transpeptidase YafK